MSKLHIEHSNVLSQSLSTTCIALTLFGDITHDEATKPLKTALENGATFWNAVRIP
jgi:hypothetical protein